MSLPGKMNMMIWGKLCWYSHPENMFPLPNVLHVVLSTTLKLVSLSAHTHTHTYKQASHQKSKQELWDFPETTSIFIVVRSFLFLQHSSKSCPLLVSRLWERCPPGCRAPTCWLNRNHLDCWWNTGLPGKLVLVSHCSKKESKTRLTS